MSQGKKDKFLPVFFGVLGVATAGLGYMGYSASSDADDAQAGYQKKVQELEALQKAPISRTEENADKKKDLVETYVKQVLELDKTLQAYQAEEKDIKGDVFQRELKKTIDEFVAAAKAKQVKVAPDFDFGMKKYLSTIPENTAPQLNAQLHALAYLGNSALEAGLLEINSLSRQELDVEKDSSPKPDPKSTAKSKPAAPPKPGDKKTKEPATPVLDESSVVHRQPVSMTVTGKNRSVLKFLELIANTKPETAPYFFVIRTLKVENEAKDGPPKNIPVALEEKADPLNKDAPPIKTDAVFVLGNEQVKMQLELDILRFIPEPPEEVKSTGKSKAAAKADAEKPEAAKPKAAPKADAPAENKEAAPAEQPAK